MGTCMYIGVLVACWALWCMAERRSPRSAAPAPVGCRMGPWHDWTRCCANVKHRYRKLEQPSKYGGDVCLGNLWESMACASAQKCFPIVDCAKDFQCRESGRCIRKELVGNGDKDCRDQSDEEDYDDSQTQSFCQELLPIPGAQNAVLGFNILTQSDSHRVLDHEYFGGQCEIVYNGEWRNLRYDPVCERVYYGTDEKYFRKPYNFHTYHFLMRADTSMAFELYDSSQDLLNAIGKEKSFGFSFAPSVRPAGSPIGIGFEIGHQSKNSFLKNISDYTSTNFKFVRLNTKIQTARFRMRRSSLMLDEDVMIALRELPETYDYGPYARFIADYGTHFVTSGIVGGILDHVLVLNEEEMRRQEISYEMTESCFSHHVGLMMSFQEGAIEGNLGLKGKSCSKFEKDFEDQKTKSKIIQDVITYAKGGDPPSTGSLVNLFDAVTYRMWGSSLKYNPAVIESELLPIYELLKLTDLSGLEKKRENLKTAYHDFLAEFNSCRCGPCENNGTPFLDNNDCLCVCPSGFEGLACERTQRQNTKANGYWSCWSSWSGCRSGTRQRSRTCNNPPPKNGGSPCLGKSTQSEFC